MGPPHPTPWAAHTRMLHQSTQRHTSAFRHLPSPLSPPSTMHTHTHSSHAGVATALSSSEAGGCCRSLTTCSCCLSNEASLPCCSSAATQHSSSRHSHRPSHCAVATARAAPSLPVLPGVDAYGSGSRSSRHCSCSNASSSSGSRSSCYDGRSRSSCLSSRLQHAHRQHQQQQQQSTHGATAAAAAAATAASQLVNNSSLTRGGPG